MCKRELFDANCVEIDDSVLVLQSPEGRKRINRAVWGPLNQTIVSGGEDAVIRIWDAEVIQNFLRVSSCVDFTSKSY